MAGEGHPSPSRPPDPSSLPAPPPGPESPYVGRGGIKLRHALVVFGIDPRGWVCADFGANVGGFTDSLLRAGAARVYAVDTGYGVLAWKLRQDPRVVVMERTNALHAGPPRAAAGPGPIGATGGLSGAAAPASAEPPPPILMDLIAIDLGWTPQRHAVPAALRWLKPGGRIVSLIKPHYETGPEESGLLRGGILNEADGERIARRTVDALPALGVRVLGLTKSPILGGASKKRVAGNPEWLALLGA